MEKNTICIWYDKDAEAAAHFLRARGPESPCTLRVLSRTPPAGPLRDKGTRPAGANWVAPLRHLSSSDSKKRSSIWIRSIYPSRRPSVGRAGIVRVRRTNPADA